MICSSLASTIVRIPDRGWNSICDYVYPWPSSYLLLMLGPSEEGLAREVPDSTFGLIYHAFALAG